MELSLQAGRGNHILSPRRTFAQVCSALSDIVVTVATEHPSQSYSL